ncbi:hypothetical protein YC2023_084536 [Brassica napus]
MLAFSTYLVLDPLHPDFFEFTGRVVTLVLMQKVQSGGATQAVFSSYSWTERKLVCKISEDTDRIMYNSCKQILEMNPVSIDSYAGLGLAFVSETEVLGERETEEILKDEKSIAVNNESREQYVSLLIKNRFATSISE